MKAVLVIDVTRCSGCPFCHNNSYYSWCDAPRKDRSWEMPLSSKDIEEERTVECPLRPLPKKMTPVTLHQCIEDEYLYQKGWNDCLEEIDEY